MDFLPFDTIEAILRMIRATPLIGPLHEIIEGYWGEAIMFDRALELMKSNDMRVECEVSGDLDASRVVTYLLAKNDTKLGFGYKYQGGRMHQMPMTNATFWNWVAGRDNTAIRTLLGQISRRPLGDMTAIRQRIREKCVASLY